MSVRRAQREIDSAEFSEWITFMEMEMDAANGSNGDRFPDRDTPKNWRQMKLIANNAADAQRNSKRGQYR